MVGEAVTCLRFQGGKKKKVNPVSTVGRQYEFSTRDLLNWSANNLMATLGTVG